MGIQEDFDRYMKAGHAIQTGVAYEMAMGGKDTEPKHLRTGINLSKSDMAGLVRLLVEKGLLTDEEYMEAIADEAEREVQRYEERINKATGGTTQITLA